MRERDNFIDNNKLKKFINIVKEDGIYNSSTILKILSDIKGVKYNSIKAMYYNLNINLNIEQYYKFCDKINIDHQLLMDDRYIKFINKENKNGK